MRITKTARAWLTGAGIGSLIAAGAATAAPLARTTPAADTETQHGAAIIHVQQKNAPKQVARPAARARVAPRAAQSRPSAQRATRTAAARKGTRAAPKRQATRTRVPARSTAASRIAKGAGIAVAGGAAAAAASRVLAAPRAPGGSAAFKSNLTAPFQSKFYKQQPLTKVAIAKPAFVVHNNYYLAGARGYRLGYRPFWYRYGGFRWYRYYYTVPLAAGGYYWYWHNCTEDEAVTNFQVSPAAIVETDVIDCDPDDDDCGESN